MNNPHHQHGHEQGNSSFAVMLTVAIALAVAIIVGVNIMYGPPKSGSNSENDIAARVAPAGTANTSGQPATVTNPAAGATAPAEKPAAAAAPAAAPAAAETPAAAPAAAATAMTGEETFKKVCFACHQAGIAGAPKFGDAAAWTARIAQGKDTLYKHAIEGFTGQAGAMPPRGGMATLKDEEVKAAVDYMVEAAGGPKAEAAPAAAAPAAAEKPAEAAAAAPAATAQAAAGGDDKGKKTFDGTCYVCHATGAAGAPKFGDAGAWGPRIAQGKDTLYKHAIEGFMGQAGMMPPRGGRPDLSDDDIKAAVDYMAAAVSK